MQVQQQPQVQQPQGLHFTDQDNHSIMYFDGGDGNLRSARVPNISASQQGTGYGQGVAQLQRSILDRAVAPQDLVGLVQSLQALQQPRITQQNQSDPNVRR